jgi:hypothetical protein
MSRGTTAALLITLLASSARATIRITCRDGAPNGRVQNGSRSVTDATVCDIDRTVDGICTFSLSCQTACRVVQCYPDELICPDSQPPCRSTYERVAIPVQPRHAAVKRMGNVSDPCPPWVGPALARLTTVRILQSDSQVSVCGPFLGAVSSGPLTPSGFDLDAGDHFGLGSGSTLYNLRETLSATLPAVGSTVDVVRRDFLTTLGPSDTIVPVCERTAGGTMVRFTMPCNLHTDCLGLDPCSRCVAGQCWTDPRCR